MGADLQAVLKGLNKEFDFVLPSKNKLLDKFLALFFNYVNSVPTWANYGASPTDMHKLLGSSDNLEVKSFPIPTGRGNFLEDADDEDGDDEEDATPWERARTAEDTPVEGLVPSVYPNGPVDFTWVKDPEEKWRRLDEYDLLCPVLMSYVYNRIRTEVDPKERKSAEKALGIRDDAEQDLDRVRTDFAANIQLLKGTNARLRAGAKKDEMKPAFQVAADYYANYSYAWLKIVAMKSGVGLKCANLLSGEELFLMEKSLSVNPQLKGMTLCAGIAPMDGNRYVIVGQGLVADFELPERFLADTLKNVGIEKVPPCSLTSEEQEKLAVSTIRRIAANPMRLRIFLKTFRRAPMFRQSVI